MFQNVKQSLGLSLGSMIALLTGIGCILASILVGLVHNIQTAQDFQAVQLWRMEWLVGAVAAFVAGILLKVKVAEK
jgi:cytosine/uracil/thiamine/allantoin permease